MFDFSRNEKGQGLVEYALILVLIAIVVIVAMTTLGDKVSGTFDDVNSELGGSGSGEVVAQPTATDAPDTGTGPKTWGNSNDVYSGDEACIAAGVASGNTAYLWGESPAMQDGFTFYWTGSSTPPVSGYSLLGTHACP